MIDCVRLIRTATADGSSSQNHWRFIERHHHTTWQCEEAFTHRTRYRTQTKKSALSMSH